MTTAVADIGNAQLRMPGMPYRKPRKIKRLDRATPGQVVQYHGRVRGGPQFGLVGTVVEARGRQAVVDLGKWGTWHIPYYLLTIPEAA